MGQSPSVSRDSKGNLVLNISGTIDDYATKGMNPSIQSFQLEFDRLYAPKQRFADAQSAYSAFKDSTNTSAADFGAFNNTVSTNYNEIDNSVKTVAADIKKLDTDFDTFKMNDYTPYKTNVEGNISNINAFVGSGTFSPIDATVNNNDFVVMK